MGSQEIKVRIMMDEGDVLGATPSENLVITRIQHGTLADGKLQVFYDFLLKIANAFLGRRQNHQSGRQGTEGQSALLPTDRCRVSKRPHRLVDSS